MKVLTILKSNLLQLGFQGLTGTPFCCAPGHALNISNCYQMVGTVTNSRIEHPSLRIAPLKKPLKNKRLNRRVRFNLDEKNSHSTSFLLVKDSNSSSPSNTGASPSFQKNKQKSRKSSASILLVSQKFKHFTKLTEFTFLFCIYTLLYKFRFTIKS